MSNTDWLDEILLDITPNLTSSHGDPDSYDAYDCIEYPSSQIAREKLTHRCLTCGLPECKPWYEAKQAILNHIDKAIGRNEGSFAEKVFDEINPFYPPSDKYIRNKLRAKIRKELGIKEGE